MTVKATLGTRLSQRDSRRLVRRDSQLHNDRRLAATTFGCAVQAGESSDLGRANPMAGANHQSAYQTVSANVLHSFTANSNKISLTCLQYAGGKWPAGVHNARLIAMKVDQINPLNAFRAYSIKVSKPKRKPKLQAVPWRAIRPAK